jgi:hypothetical protein
MGFPGSPHLVHYFWSMKKKKKESFFYKPDPRAYDFFDTVPEELSGWLKSYYYIMMTGSVMTLLFLITGGIAALFS